MESKFDIYWPAIKIHRHTKLNYSIIQPTELTLYDFISSPGHNFSQTVTIIRQLE